MDERFWDEMYTGHDRWSGKPNGTLVEQVSDLPPGRALDIGCGEGADALWLAARGWQVTAADISSVALERAAVREKSAEAGAAPNESGRQRVTWTHLDLTGSWIGLGTFDLVSAQYFPLLREEAHASLRGLLDTVAPGGTLLVVSHDVADMPAGENDHGVDFHAYYRPDEIAALLDDSWSVLIDAIRPRVNPPPGTDHVRDAVFRARRN